MVVGSKPSVGTFFMWAEKKLIFSWKINFLLKGKRLSVFLVHVDPKKMYLGTFIGAPPLSNFWFYFFDSPKFSFFSSKSMCILLYCKMTMFLYQTKNKMKIFVGGHSLKSQFYCARLRTSPQRSQKSNDVTNRTITHHFLC